MATLFVPELEAHEVADALPKYSNVREFVHGGQGVLFKALAPDGTAVVIKVYPPDDGTLITRAELEVQKLKQIRSKYMVRLVESGYMEIRGRQSFFTVTRFEEGEDLRRYLSSRGTLSDAETRLLVTHICTAIDEMWQARVVHCDIKPENILVGSDGVFRLVDLGLAKHLDEKTITQFGITMGTLGYMAPEQMFGRKNYTLRVDLFALGIVAYECITGVHPFGRNQSLIAQQLRVEPPSSIVDLSTDLENAIMKMLQWNPLLRPRSGAEVIAMIGG